MLLPSLSLHTDRGHVTSLTQWICPSEDLLQVLLRHVGKRLDVFLCLKEEKDNDYVDGDWWTLTG